MIAFLSGAFAALLIAVVAYVGLERVDETTAAAHSAPSVRLGDAGKGVGDTPGVESGPEVGGEAPSVPEPPRADSDAIDVTPARVGATKAIQPDAVRLTREEDTIKSGPEVK
ncbi:MAG: hypothetical protein KDG89_16050 [Geminicoccaceae bacterium]|nr:hypothetical protein [Geminicoccaceae bacterium]